MKKFVCCVYLLLAVFCTTAMAQDTYNILEIEGMVPQTNGQTTYYIKNVGTGLYVSYGGGWGKHCKESRAAHPFVIENNGDGTVAIASLAGYLASDEIWMDWARETSKWVLVPAEGYTNQYYLIGDNDRALTSVGNSAGVLGMTPATTNKAAQRWIFLTENEIRSNRMTKATAEKPFDVTPLIKGAAFDLIDGEADLENTPTVFDNIQPYLDKYWTNLGANRKWNMWECGVWTGDPNLYNYCGIINGTSNALTITYKVTLPAGTYSFSFEGFYKHLKTSVEQDQKKSSAVSSWKNSGSARTTTTGANMTVNVSFDGASKTLASHPNNDIYDNGELAGEEFRDNDNYKHSGTFYLSSSKEVSITIAKSASDTDGESTKVTSQGGTIIKYDNARTITTTTYKSQIFVDNFTLLYFGSKQLAESEVNDKNLFESYLDANIDEFIESLPEEDKEAAREALESLDKDNITSVEDFYAALEELENTLTDIEQEKKKQEAMGGITIDTNGNIVDKDGNIIEGGNADLTGFIKNASFEKGTLTGWILEGHSDDTGVKANNNVTYKTVGTDGNYLFNTWTQGAPIGQVITGLPNGVYKMTVSLAADVNNTAILVANNYQREVTLTAGKETFNDFSIKFRVTDGTATIGVLGGESVDGLCWYKADNFRLTLLNDYLVLDENDTELLSNKLRSADYWYGNVTIKRSIKNTNWSTFVVPFDIPASWLSGWEVKELVASEMDESGNITLEFADAPDGIKAGVPYMVRNLGITAEAPFTGIQLQDIHTSSFSTTLNDVETDHIAFRGVWTKGYIPKGSYFISGNKFYVSVKDNADAIKGFRAYLEPKDTNKARSIGYRFAAKDEEGTTEIEEQTTEEATVVAIYTLGGVRIDEMQQGVNILQMSDGSVVRVVIK